MNTSEIAAYRLSSQGLENPLFETPAEVVGWLGAIQAQDYLATKWTIGMRMRDATDARVEQAFNDGSILRTHVMRPTWHFVLPADIRWMQALTAPRVQAANGSMYRKLELDQAVITQSIQIITKALQGGKQLTRTELANALEAGGIQASGQRLAYIIMRAELEAIICSGGRRGKQFTYALLDERAPNAIHLERDEALGRLAKSYFLSHGPAQQRDFAWWSGLTMKEAGEGIELVKTSLTEETMDGKKYWFSPDSKIAEQISTTAWLMSIYDEYTIAYNDRSALGEEKYFEKLILMGNALTSVIVLDGKIAGTWKREFKRGTVHLSASPFYSLGQSRTRALHMAAENYGKFHDMPVEILETRI